MLRRSSRNFAPRHFKKSAPHATVARIPAPPARAARSMRNLSRKCPFLDTTKTDRNKTNSRPRGVSCHRDAVHFEAKTVVFPIYLFNSRGADGCAGVGIWHPAAEVAQKISRHATERFVKKRRPFGKNQLDAIGNFVRSLLACIRRREAGRFRPALRPGDIRFRGFETAKTLSVRTTIQRERICSDQCFRIIPRACVRHRRSEISYRCRFAYNRW